MAILGKGKEKGEEFGSRILDVTASMQGSLIFQEPVALRISGRFEGTLETRGALTIGEKAVVQADIIGEEIIIAGTVTGKVVAKQILRVVPPAMLRGDFWTPVLQVEQGARLEGAIHMTEETAWMTPEEVAEYLEVEVRLVEQWARERKLPAIQEGNRWRFEKAKIDGWIATQKSS